MDWTDLPPFQQLVFSPSRDGRALPFLVIMVRKGSSEEETKGVMLTAERLALDVLARLCPPEGHPILITDRGFGHPRWLTDIQKRAWHFMKRLSHIHQVLVEHHMGTLKELGIRWGWMAGTRLGVGHDGRARVRADSARDRV